MVALVAVLPTLPGLVSGGRLIPGDGFETPLPGLVAGAQAILSGAPTGWTELVYGGAPIVSSGGVGLCWPPNLLLFALLPAGLAYTAALGLHTALAAAGAWSLTRRLGGTATGAALAAMGFAGGGFLMAHTENLVRIEALAFLPWCWWAVEALVGAAEGRARRRAAALLGLVLGGALLTGYFPFSVYLWGSTAAWGLIRALQQGAGEPRVLPRLGAWLLTAAALGVLVGAVQLLPTWEASTTAQRVLAPEADFPFDNSLHPGQLGSLLLPFAYEADPWDAQLVFYIGLLPLGLLPWALWPLPPRRDPRWALLALGALSLLLALGAWLPGYGLLVDLVPALELLGRPYRLFMGAALAATCAAGLAWGRAPRSKGGASLVALPAVAAVGLAACATDAGALELAPVVAGLGAALTWVASRRWGARAATVAVALVALELALFQARLLGVVAPSPLGLQDATPPATAHFLRARLAPDERFLSLRAPGRDDPGLLWMQTPMGLGLPTLNTPLTSLVPADYAELWEPSLLGLAPDALALGRASWALAPADLQLPGRRPARFIGAVAAYELGPTWPRVRLLPRWEVLPRPALRERVQRGEGLDVVLLEREPAGLEGPPGCGELEILRRGPAVLELTVDNPGACLLVISDRHDSGWRAWLDGEPTTIHRAYGWAQAVALPAGARQLELRWVPRSLQVGLAATLLGLLLAGALAAGRRFRSAGRRAP